jgi:hypothetical protein
MKTVIRSQSDLDAFKPRASRRELRQVTLELAGDPQELRRAERVINESLQACGCKTGAIFVVGALAVLCLVYRVRPLSAVSPQELMGAFGFLIAVAFVGKITGLALAEWNLRQTLERVRRLT